MEKEVLQKITKYVEDNIGDFHKKRIEKIKKINLKKIIGAKNPYLFKAKNMLTASNIVQSVLSASISSSEETVFGNWLEQLAIFISLQVDNGMKSSADGIDLELVKDSKRYLVVIKSGKVWGNKSQVDKMKDNFIGAQRRLKTSGNKGEIVFVNGICYGKSKKNVKTPKSGPDYLFLCGQEFWEFISGDANLYTDIVEPLGHKAKEKNDEYNVEYSALENRLIEQFLKDFCVEGTIDWEKLVKFNSGKSVPVVKKASVKKAKVGKLEKLKKKMKQG